MTVQDEYREVLAILEAAEREAARTKSVSAARRVIELRQRAADLMISMKPRKAVH
jgi:hypothetical protein